MKTLSNTSKRLINIPNDHSYFFRYTMFKSDIHFTPVLITCKYWDLERYYFKFRKQLKFLFIHYFVLCFPA